MSYIEELNSSQRAAVECTEGPMLVVAGAGSGKTRVLTYKIAYLLEKGVPAYHILALTFTNKAAREMKNRICALVGEERARYLWMGTFHSIFAKILRKEADKLGYTPDYTIYDTTDSKNLVKSIVKEMELDDKVYKTSTVLGRISMAKNNLYTPNDYANDNEIQQQDRQSRLYRMKDIFYLYNKRLRQANAMDFDDLLFNMNLLLHTNAEAREKYQQLFQYILVDEYQDTNYSQYRIVSILSAPQQNICVVGDDAQSIYSFRGATIANILNFQREYAGCKLFKLEQNYRSTQTIVNAANSLIRANQEQIPKTVFSEKEVGKPLQVHAFDTDRLEGAFVAKRIRRPYDNYAVLYRTNSQSRIIEDELRKAGIPYRIYGSVAFYQRREIKDAIAYFRLAANSQDDEALQRVINFPARGIGNTTMSKVLQTAHEQDVAAFEVVQNPTAYNVAISTATANKLTRFAGMIQAFREAIPTMGAYEFARYVLTTSQVMMAAQGDKSAEGVDRLENLNELLSGIQEFEKEQSALGTEVVPITEFLSEVSLLTDQDEQIDDSTPRVTLMTVHSAKGLEFPVVIIVGMEDKLFPSAFAQTQREMEEERRLLYVAITRAEEECILTYAKTRFRNGTVAVSTMSPFINDIDRQYIQLERPIYQAPMMPMFHRPMMSEPKITERNNNNNMSERKLHKIESGGGKKVPELRPKYAIGSRVSHATFGEGTVLRAYNENGNDKIEIRFDGFDAPKTLLLKFAKLEQL